LKNADGNFLFLWHPQPAILWHFWSWLHSPHHTTALLQALCFVYYPFKLQTPLRRKRKFSVENKESAGLLKYVYGGFSWTLQME
jgi:hypothetical protein